MAAVDSSVMILYVGGGTAGLYPRQSRVVRGLPVLTVGDSEAFWNAGGIIAFHVSENRMRFRINLGVAEKAGLKISSQLLALASTVDRGSSR